VPLDDLRNASELLVRALLIRQKYMNMSSQQFPTATARFLHQISSETAAGTSEQNPVNLPYQTGLCSCCIGQSTKRACNQSVDQ